MAYSDSSQEFTGEASQIHVILFSLYQRRMFHPDFVLTIGIQEWLTAMITSFKHSEYTIIPFGICNAPLTFQHSFKEIFADLVEVFVVVYLNEIHKCLNSFEKILYQKFINNYSRTIVNLTSSLLLKDTLYVFTEKASRDFKTLKKDFTTAPLLAHFIELAVAYAGSTSGSSPI
ncbi:uncharacterized protein VP01_2192g4 [Puccinia sorghi]|uniref:Uncharacterized protein n=1 Tax=Puccinia sorghi TaxID=27349 RepID=A0A0L6V9Q1_9BASI|nr:uncharacterized protein VP01_2192g4 [Puccinia sorghi]